MATVTIGIAPQKQIPRPVRVVSSAGEYREEFKGQEVVIPEGDGGLIMDRNQARDFLSQTTPMVNDRGVRTPKALKYFCIACNTENPPKGHKCFQENMDKLGILEKAEHCDHCGDEITVRGGLKLHYQRKHPDTPFVDGSVSSNDTQVAILQGQVDSLIKLVAAVLGKDAAALVLPPKAEPVVPFEADEKPKRKRGYSLEALGEEFS